MSKRIGIVCDGCSTVMAVATTAGIARREIGGSAEPRLKGAKVRTKGGSRDYCGPCATRVYAEAHGWRG